MKNTMKTNDEMNDLFRAMIDDENPRPAGGFETEAEETEWRERNEARFTELSGTTVEETERADFTIWGSWEGNQAGAIALIENLDGAAEHGAQLFDVEGHAARDNTVYGGFKVPEKQKTT